MTVNLIAYVSDYVETSDNIDDVLINISLISKRNNAEEKVTGVLFFMEGKFLQILEGNKENVSKIIERVKQDPRHENFEILMETQIKKRGFRYWSMEGLHLKAGKEFSHDYIKTITRAFENMMMPQSNVLAEFYKSLLEEKTYRESLFSKLKNLLFPKNRIMICSFH